MWVPDNSVGGDQETQVETVGPRFQILSLGFQLTCNVIHWAVDRHKMSFRVEKGRNPSERERTGKGIKHGSQLDTGAGQDIWGSRKEKHIGERDQEEGQEFGFECKDPEQPVKHLNRRDQERIILKTSS